MYLTCQKFRQVLFFCNFAKHQMYFNFFVNFYAKNSNKLHFEAILAIINSTSLFLVMLWVKIAVELIFLCSFDVYQLRSTSCYISSTSCYISNTSLFFIYITRQNFGQLQFCQASKTLKFVCLRCVPKLLANHRAGVALPNISSS